MKQTKAPIATPSPEEEKTKRVALEPNPNSVFISMALDMSWRLAIAVLAPVITGAELSKHFKNSDYLIIGLIVAMLLALIVISQTYKQATLATVKYSKKKGPKV